MKTYVFLLLGCCFTDFVVGVQQEPVDYNNEEIGIKFQLPNATWKLDDQSQGIAKVLIFKPKSTLGERAVILVFPKSALPEGVLTREKQIKGPYGEVYRRIGYEDVKFAGHDAKRLEYEVAQSRSVEWGIPDGDFYFIFQVSARKDAWEKPDVSKTLNSIRDSVEYRGGVLKKAVPEADRSTPQQVHGKRKLAHARAERAFELTQG